MWTLRHSNQVLFFGQPHLGGMIFKVIDINRIEPVARGAFLVLAQESIKLVSRAALGGKHIFWLIASSDEPEPSSHT